jgi:hypothetical protein
MKRKTPAPHMLAAVTKENQKVSKSRKKYARIIQMPVMLEYLVGQRIRVVPGEVVGRIYGVVQKEGYEGTPIAFEDHEIVFD